MAMILDTVSTPWLRFIVCGHKCSLGHDLHGNRLPFYASSLETAQSFQRYWGGEVYPA